MSSTFFMRIQRWDHISIGHLNAYDESRVVFVRVQQRVDSVLNIVDQTFGTLLSIAPVHDLLARSV